MARSYRIKATSWKPKMGKGESWTRWPSLLVRSYGCMGPAESTANSNISWSHLLVSISWLRILYSQPRLLVRASRDTLMMVSLDSLRVQGHEFLKPKFKPLRWSSLQSIYKQIIFNIHGCTYIHTSLHELFHIIRQCKIYHSFLKSVSTSLAFQPEISIQRSTNYPAPLRNMSSDIQNKDRTNREMMGSLNHRRYDMYSESHSRSMDSINALSCASRI